MLTHEFSATSMCSMASLTYLDGDNDVALMLLLVVVMMAWFTAPTYWEELDW